MAIGFLAWRPPRLHSAYQSDVALALRNPLPSLPTVSDAQLMRLPAAVGRYLRRVGVVGQPQVANFRVRLHGRIRSDADARWMPLRAEQYNFVGERRRFFYLTSSLFGIPVQGYHRYADGAASMDIKAAGLVTIAHVTGPEMLQGETVTLLNDMCLLAPATLIDPALQWEEVNALSTRVTFANAGAIVHAELIFDQSGGLIDFVSDDRYQASPDGKRLTRLRWSTPVRAYRAFGPYRLGVAGEARWHAADGPYAYIELKFDDIQYNVSAYTT